MSIALGLMRLQQVDIRIGQVEAELARITADLASDAELRAAQEEADSAEASWMAAEQKRREAEIKAAAVRDKIQQAEAALYGGKVPNPKELQELQAEVGALKRQLGSIEEAELHWMEQLEAVDQQRQQAREHLAQAVGARDVKSQRLSARRSELARAQSDLQSEREAAAGGIAADHLRAYDVLRQSRRGIAVTNIQDGACSSCGTTLTAALQQAARHSPELRTCPSCGRILFGD